MDSLIQTVLASLKRKELPSTRALGIVGDDNPAAAARALLRAARTPELATSCDLWVPSLLLSPRPGMGASRLCELAYAHVKCTGETLEISRMPGLAPLLGASEGLGLMLVDNPDWTDDLIGDPPASPVLTRGPGSFREIREIHARGQLNLSARHLLGCPVETTLAEVSALADFCLLETLARASRETGFTAPAMFALGQLGSRELGLRSAVEVLWVDDERDQEMGSRDAARRSDRQRELACLLDRVEREAAPDAGSAARYRFAPERPLLGLVANCVDHAADTFSSDRSSELERLTERVRPLCGESSATAEATNRLRRIVAPRPTAGRRGLEERGKRAARIESADAEDLVFASGGMRDIEAIVRHLGLEGDHATVQKESPGVLVLLYSIGESIDDSIDASKPRCSIDIGIDPRQLIDAYCWLRRAEHALHMMTTHGSHIFPRDPVGQQQLARCMGYREVDACEARARLLSDRQDIRQTVENQFDSTFARVRN